MSIADLTIPVNGLDYEIHYEAAREVVDYAARWCWHVYDKVEKALGAEKAAETANAVQTKIFEKYIRRLAYDPTR